MLTCHNNYVPLGQLKTSIMPRQARKTSGTGVYLYTSILSTLGYGIIQRVATDQRTVPLI